jgi:phosphohistidine phosphatase
MSLYLVQHALAHDKATDPRRPLTEEGVADVTRIAEVAADYGVSVDRIGHSGVRRARQTAEVLARHLPPARGVVELGGLGPMDDVAEFARQLPGQSDLMLVGHLPFMARLCSHLITGSAETPVFRFQNGGIVCLMKLPDPAGWVIKWALMPEVG